MRGYVRRGLRLGWNGLGGYTGFLEFVLYSKGISNMFKVENRYG